MIKTIFGSLWILAGIAALFLGLNGQIDSAGMVIFSLVALTLFYASAVWTVITTQRGSPSQVFNGNE